MSKVQIPLSARHQVATRSQDYCEARIPGVCKGTGQHLHHRKMRSQSGDHSPENLVMLCTKCHSYAHLNPRFSYEVELLVHEWDDISIPAEELRYRIREAVTD